MDEISVWKLEMIYSNGELLDVLYFSTQDLVEKYIKSLNKHKLTFDIQKIEVFTSL